MSPENTESLFEQGLSLFHRGKYSEASSYFSQIVKKFPEKSEALYNLACCYSMMGKPKQALLHLSRAARYNPHCKDWANEDHELEAVRKSPIFRKIIGGAIVDDEEIDLEGEPEFVSVNKTAEPSRVEEIPPIDNVVPKPVKKKVHTTFTTTAESVTTESEARNTETGGQVKETDQQKSQLPASLMNDQSIKSKAENEKEFPPCIQCGGLILEEKRHKHSQLLMLLIVYIGILSVFFLFYSVAGLIGLPVIFLGLYMFTQTEKVWVCQNCGASGHHCGQPKNIERQESVSFSKS